jgi:hypothetical protein
VADDDEPAVGVEDRLDERCETLVVLRHHHAQGRLRHAREVDRSARRMRR